MERLTFAWPELLWLLLLVPVLVGAYLALLRRRKKAALRYASLGLVREALGRGPGFRRHVPPLLFLAGLVALLVALARPSALVTLPSQQELIVLAMDVSGSMRATDVEPNRLAAAQAAARAFVAAQPSRTRIGVVAFAGTASVVQGPTHRREDVLDAIDRFEVQRATAIGSAILISLKTIFPDVEFDLRGSNPRPEAARAAQGAPLGSAEVPEKPAFTPVPPGSYPSAVIILLSDGRTTMGPDPVEAARMVAERGVRIFTVGVGTKEGGTLGYQGWSMRVRLDEAALKAIAEVTRGEYFHADSATSLTQTYESLSARVVMERKETEVTALLAAAALVLTLAAGALSVLWFHRIL
jgi:Ca-activated chloride channel family protein